MEFRFLQIHICFRRSQCLSSRSDRELGSLVRSLRISAFADAIVPGSIRLCECLRSQTVRRHPIRIMYLDPTVEQTPLYCLSDDLLSFAFFLARETQVFDSNQISVPTQLPRGTHVRILGLLLGLLTACAFLHVAAYNHARNKGINYFLLVDAEVFLISVKIAYAFVR